MAPWIIPELTGEVDLMLTFSSADIDSLGDAMLLENEERTEVAVVWFRTDPPTSSFVIMPAPNASKTTPIFALIGCALPDGDRPKN
jgi:hypothetical protein